MAKKKEVKINKELQNAVILGILSQKKPHELVQALNTLFQIEFNRTLLKGRELFQAKDEETHYYFLLGNDFPGSNSDYLLIMLSAKKELFDIQMFNTLKYNQLILGIYNLQLTKKQQKELLSLIV